MSTPTTRLTINATELCRSATGKLGILITDMSVIDGVSGEVLRIAKLTPELAELFTKLEINTDVILELNRMKEKNPKLKKLISTFNLVTE